MDRGPGLGALVLILVIGLSACGSAEDAPPAAGPDAGRQTPDAGAIDAGDGGDDAGEAGDVGFEDDGGPGDDGGFEGDGGPDADAGFEGDGGPDDDAGFEGDGGPDADAGFEGDGGPDGDAGFEGDGGPGGDAGFEDDGGPDGGAHTRALPDLRVSPERLLADLSIGWEFYGPSSCAVQEACLGGVGWRRLMRFSTRIENVGTADLVLGPPEGNPDFEFAECHHHYHLRSSTDQRLLDLEGTTVVRGLKQGFCWTDNERVEEMEPRPPRFEYAGEESCNTEQGLTVGWADVYLWDIDCQYLDITGVPPGEYELQVTVNPAGLLPELDHENNTATVPVTVPPSSPP